ncbi:MAG: folylpolyglutamate synthase/dihydrofolate synthase family protein [Bacteroidota bacterium]
MTYQETISFLYERLPMFTRIGAAAYKKDLHNTIALLTPLGNPEKAFKSIHIAGTNGKGSTSHMLAAIFHANGYKTGLYTSPHLKDFGERIKVSRGEQMEMISEQFVIGFVKRVTPLLDQIEPSFFELTVAMAFQYFKEEKIDIAIIETGLGGRLDSTNVITPDLSIITNIGWDHMNLLGDSLDKIAFEKAGIIKKNIPVVIGETLPETKPVFTSKAAIENAPLFFAEDDEIIHTKQSIDTLLVQYQTGTTTEEYETDLAGLYQQYNLRTILKSVSILQGNGWQLDPAKTRQALRQVKTLTGLHGRWELVHKDPLVILDVGHNEDGIKQVLKQIKTMQHQLEKIHMVIGMVKDKEVEKVLQLLPADYFYYFTNAHIPRAMPATELQQKAAEFGLTGSAFEHVNDALNKALLTASQKDLVIVCGSVFVVGEVTIPIEKTAL